MLGCTRVSLSSAFPSGRTLLIACTMVMAAGGARAQAPFAEDRPAPYVPLRPTTRQELDRRDSLKQYVLGLLLEHEDQLLEALKAFQEAARLDPDAPAVFKVQAPLLLTLGREKDALAAVNKALELDPGDHEIWFVAARLHKSLGDHREARKALKRGLEKPGLLDRPDVAQQMYLDLAGMCELADDIPEALAALQRRGKNPRPS